MSVRVVGMTLVVLLSGCVGALGPHGNQTGTATPPEATDVAPNGSASETPGTDAAGTDRSQSERPPGVNETGLVDTSALLDAHWNAVGDRAHASELWINASTAAGNVTLSNTRRWVRRADGNGHVRTTYNQSGGGLAPRELRDEWTNGTLALTKHVEETGYDQSNTWYRRSDGENETETQHVLGAIKPHLAVGNYSTRTVEREDGETRLTLVADGMDVSGETDGGRIEDYEGRLVVDGSGRIVSVDISFAVNNSRSGKGVVDSTISYESRRVGGDVAVDRPSWFDTAAERAPRIAIDLSVVDGRHVEVTNTGTDPIPSGTSFMLLHNGSGMSASNSEPVAPGDSVYLTYPSENAAPELSTTPPDGGIALSGEYTVSVQSGEAPELASESVTTDSSA